MAATSEGWLKRREPTRRQYLLKRVIMGPNGCWLWRSGNPYGQANYECIEEPAHIMSYKEFNGPISQGQIVRHICDMPRCIRPDHLILGTKKDNRRDFMERHPRAKELIEELKANAGHGVKRFWDRFASLEERQEWCRERAAKQRAIRDARTMF